MRTLYEHAGNADTLYRLAKILDDKAATDPLRRTLLRERVPTHADHLTGPFRQGVRSHVESGARIAQQNPWAETDADLHPIHAGSALAVAGPGYPRLEDGTCLIPESC